MAPPYIQSECASISLAVPGSRAAGGDGVVVSSEPLTLAVPGSRAADGDGDSTYIYIYIYIHAVAGAAHGPAIHTFRA